MSNLQTSVLAGFIEDFGNEWSAAEWASSFFQSEQTLVGESGAVETPAAVARFIVERAWRTYHNGEDGDSTRKLARDIKWADPAVGAGAFPLQVVQKYLDEGLVKSETDLPIVSCWDTSELALRATVGSLSQLLKDHGMDIRRYLELGRFTVNLGDYLRVPTVLKLADIIVGNPPYIRAARLGASEKAFLRSNYSHIYSGAADYSSYFWGGAVAALPPHGVVAFITPAVFMRAASGQRLRGYLREKMKIRDMFDLDETPVFPGFSLHSAITVLQRDAGPEDVQYDHVSTLEELEELVTGQRLTSHRRVDVNDAGGWTFELLTAKRRPARPLSRTLAEHGIQVHSGVRTGAAGAFLISHDQYRVFDESVRDEWLKPIVLATDIRAWATAVPSKYIIWTPQERGTPPAPILDWLEQFKDRVERRPEVRRLNEWFSLRSSTYYGAMSDPCVTYPDICSIPRFGLAGAGDLVSDGAFILTTTDPAVLAILNSKVALDYFRRTCGSVGSLQGKGRFRMKMQAIRSFPMPIDLEGCSADELRQAAGRQTPDSQTTDEIDALVARMYANEL